MLSHTALGYIVRKWAMQINMKKRITPHSARAGVITSLLDQGEDIYAVAQMIGHSRTSTTQIYHKKKQNYIKSPLSKKFAHMSSISLYHYGKRNQLVKCCDDSWYKYIDKFDWKRPWAKTPNKKFSDRVRRASEPNEILHIDITQIKVATGKTYYLQTVLDNYSRYILGWELHSSPLGGNTAKLIRGAIENINSRQPGFPGRARFISDRGKENLNTDVEKVIEKSQLEHRLHKVHIRYSNNMLEVFFRSLKNHYLNYLPAKTKRDLLRRLRFYLTEHNDHVPLAALDGATPKEKYFSTWIPPNKDEKLQLKAEAKKQRLKENRAEACRFCWEV